MRSPPLTDIPALSCRRARPDRLARTAISVLSKWTGQRLSGAASWSIRPCRNRLIDGEAFGFPHAASEGQGDEIRDQRQIGARERPAPAMTCGHQASSASATQRSRAMVRNRPIRLRRDGAGMLAAPAESFQETLAGQRCLNPDIAQVVADDRCTCRETGCRWGKGSEQGGQPD